MKSHKIRRLELVSDKIEAEDSKRNVVCIRFSCPMKKTEHGWGLPCWAAIAGLESLIASHGELAGEVVEGEQRRGAGDAAGYVGCRGAMGSSYIGEGSRPLTPCFCSVHANCCMRKKGGKREERRKWRKRKKRKERKNVEIFPNLKNFGEKNRRQFMKLV
jgi:hypothetical protein